jgi:hypothetical protein
MFVNLIDTFPAFAVSELFENFNWPPGSAASESEPLLAAGVELVGVDAARVLEELGAPLLVLLLLEPPHAATATASAIALSAMAGNLDTEHLLSMD